MLKLNRKLHAIYQVDWLQMTCPNKPTQPQFPHFVLLLYYSGLK